jgi:hypothetical protein
MADDRKFGNLYVPESAWWTLRNKFRQTIPNKVTQSYVASALNIQPRTAVNLVSALRAIGLIDDDGKPTELVNRWRDDSGYAEVCEQIRNNIYPQELRDLYSHVDSDPNQVKGWFKSKFGLGENTATKLARFYVLLLRADASKEAVSSAPKQPKVVTATSDKGTQKTRTRPSTKSPATQAVTSQSGTQSSTVDDLTGKGNKNGLSLHIDIQIHISPETTLDQIDKIFESMAKHLNK